MKFVDYDGEIITPQDLKAEWEVFRKEEPENHAPDFKTELLEILMATINGRNDMEIIGMTPAETSRFINRLRTEGE